MNTLHTFFTWTLDVSLRASLLAAAVLLIQTVLRGRISARWRYAPWLPEPEETILKGRAAAAHDAPRAN